MLAWDDVKDEFTREGSLRDICLLETTMEDWRTVWRMVRTGRLDITYTVDGLTAAPPEDVARPFALRPEHTCMLAILVAGIQLNCHFFDESEIEFDVDPRQVTGQEQLDAVVSFMASLASATNRVALMTPENMHEHAFLRVQPSADTEYISTGGYFLEAANHYEQARRNHSTEGSGST